MSTVKVNAWLEKIQENEAKMQQKDSEAKRKGILKGRFIREPYADGFAFYEIIRENKKTVRIRAIKNIGDDWTIPFWGEETTIDKLYAQHNVGQRDRLAELFRSKR